MQTLLPIEIWDKILSFAVEKDDVKSFLCLSHVCFSFRSLLSSRTMKVEKEFGRLPQFLQLVSSVACISLPVNLVLSNKVRKVKVLGGISHPDGEINITMDKLKKLCIKTSEYKEVIVNARKVSNLHYYTGKVDLRNVKVSKARFRENYVTLVNRAIDLCHVLDQIRENVKEVTFEKKISMYSFPSVPFPKLERLEGCEVSDTTVALSPKLGVMKRCKLETVIRHREPLLVIYTDKPLEDIILSENLTYINKYHTVFLLQSLGAKKAVEMLPCSNYPVNVFFDEGCYDKQIFRETLSLLEQKYKLSISHLN